MPFVRVIVTQFLISLQFTSPLHTVYIYIYVSEFMCPQYQSDSVGWHQFVFFCMKQCIIPHIIISFCPNFLKHFLLIFISIQGKPKHTVCTPKGWLNVSTVFGHMMPSA